MALPCPVMPALRRLALWALLAIPALTACVSTSAVVVGESPVPPPTNIPFVPVAVTDESGAPVRDAVVKAGDGVVTADASGIVHVAWQGRPINVSIEAPGFFPGAVAVESFTEDPIALELRPVVLRGTVTDTGARPLGGATARLGEQSAISSNDGVFEIVRAVPGVLEVSRPGWLPTAVTWTGDTLSAAVTLEPRIIRGLHVAGVISGNESEWNNLLEIAEETVVNSLVIDLKDESGRVFYDSDVALAEEIGAVQPAYDLAEVVRDLRARDLYIIGRIVTFQDPIAAQRKPDLAVSDTATGAPYQSRGQFFLDPTDPGAQQYALGLAVEACDAGVEEIQFDYVRYPDGFPASARFDGGADAETRASTIAGFLDRAGDLLHPKGCAVAADIFGFITSTPEDGGIGQQFEMLSQVTDVLSPMIYPSHYSQGWFGFATPNDHPGPVVASAIDDGLTRLEGAALVRPWLQDFFYDSSQVRAQIEEAEARSLGWMLWNAASNFQTGALDPEPAEPVGTTPTPATTEPAAEASGGS